MATVKVKNPHLRFLIEGLPPWRQETVLTEQTPIQPEAFFSDTDLLLKLDIPRSVQAQARQAGTLQFIKAGSSVLYKGQWVLDWLEGGVPTVRHSIDGAKLRRKRKQEGSTVTQSHADPVAEFTRQVEALVVKGVDSNAAPGAIARVNPELYRAHLSAISPKPAATSPRAGTLANDGGDIPMTQAQTHADAIAGFTQEVEARMAKGLDRDAAVRAVATAKPRLHKAYLAATNPGAAAAGRI